LREVLICKGFIHYKSEKKLPHLKGPLAKVMASSAIESANAVVKNVISHWLKGSG